jgi:hypothetical protein
MLSEREISTMFSSECSERIIFPKICTTRDLLTMFTCPPSFVCYSDFPPVAFTILARSWTIADIGGLNSGSCCIMKRSDQ